MKSRTYVFCDFETTGLFNISTNNVVYPIEIGLIITDENFVIYETYERLIRWENLYKQISESKKGESFVNDYYEWPPFAKKAYTIHKIEALEYYRFSKDKKFVAEELYSIVSKYNNPILMSDNIQFEWKLMEILLSDYCKQTFFKWPFHYCGYDTSEILIRTGVGDPKAEHRALRDAALLHQHMIRALERMKMAGFENV